MFDGLEIPEFLRVSVPRPKPRPIRWKRFAKAARPEGERWANAERWEVFCDNRVPQLGCGLRRLWVVEGRKWARLHDGHAQCKMPMAVWRQLQRGAKEVQS